jgi:hypothetical protein
MSHQQLPGPDALAVSLGANLDKTISDERRGQVHLPLAPPLEQEALVGAWEDLGEVEQGLIEQVLRFMITSKLDPAARVTPHQRVDKLENSRRVRTSVNQVSNLADYQIRWQSVVSIIHPQTHQLINQFLPVPRHVPDHCQAHIPIVGGSTVQAMPGHSTEAVFLKSGVLACNFVVFPGEASAGLIGSVTINP